MYAIVNISLLLTAGYILLMIAYSIGWCWQKVFFLPAGYQPKTYISIIIPARNEEDNIGACIESILAQNYPPALFEIIVVDDHSTDATGAIAESFRQTNIGCIRLSEYTGNQKITSYKKAAITLGVDNSKGELIITTDADCIAPKEWLRTIAAKYEQEKLIMIIAPVIYTCNNSILQVFQLTDFLSMQGITAAAYNLKLGNMSNGANLAFTKSAFKKIGGYAGVDHIASGDDYLLMMKLSKLQSGNITYLKSQEAVITTAPQQTWSRLLNQRIRWASKSGKYDDKRLTAILLLVYLFNFSFLVLAIGGLYNNDLFKIVCLMLALKIFFEYLFLIPVARFFRQTKVLWYFPFLQPLHIAYIIIAGFLGFKGGYIWKGRKVT